MQSTKIRYYFKVSYLFLDHCHWVGAHNIYMEPFIQGLAKALRNCNYYFLVPMKVIQWNLACFSMIVSKDQ